MEKNIEFLQEISAFRYKSGKAHLFHSANKIIKRYGTVIKTDKIYVSKEYLDYLSQKMFGDKNRIRSFFSGKNNYVRLSFVEEFLGDFNRDIVAEIQEDFLELKKINSENSALLRKRLTELLETEAELNLEDMELLEKYFKNWKRLEKRISYLIPDEFYGQKNSYYYTALISYTKFFKKLNPTYEKVMNFIENK